MTRTPIFEINSLRKRCLGYGPEEVMHMVSSTRHPFKQRIIDGRLAYGPLTSHERILNRA